MFLSSCVESKAAFPRGPEITGPRNRIPVSRMWEGVPHGTPGPALKLPSILHAPSSLICWLNEGRGGGGRWILRPPAEPLEGRSLHGAVLKDCMEQRVRPSPPPPDLVASMCDVSKDQPLLCYTTKYEMICYSSGLLETIGPLLGEMRFEITVFKRFSPRMVS